MQAESTTESQNVPSYQRNAELIIKHLNEYLGIRFDMAARINPELATIKQDLMYHETANIRRCLTNQKIYGPIKTHVADVFLSDDDVKRRNLMSPTDQTSVQVELVSHVQEGTERQTTGQLKIHDLRSFYSSINPRLADFMDLYESWIWWDIYDSSELTRFEQKLGIIQSLKRGIPDKLRMRYSVRLHPDADAAATAGGKGEAQGQKQLATDAEIMAYEVAQLDEIRRQWELRRNYEHGYMFVLMRDETPRPDQGEMIHRIADKVRDYDTIAGMEELDSDTRHLHAPQMGLAPERVTREALLHHLQHQLIELEREMIGLNDADAHLGPPYNYKRRQSEKMDRWLEELHAQVNTAAPAQQPAGGAT